MILVFEDPLDGSASLVEATTRLPGRDDHSAPERDLARLAHCDGAVSRPDWLAYDHAAAAEPDGPVALSDADIVIGVEPCAVTVLSFRHYRAARFFHGSTTGTIASRHCPLGQLNQMAVPSIEPHLAWLYRIPAANSAAFAGSPAGRLHPGAW